MKKFNYENTQYLEKLDQLDASYYAKYVKHIEQELKRKKKRYLDVGCGNGVVINQLSAKGYVNGYGVDVSKIFISQGKKRGIKNLYHFNGKTLKFKKDSFDVVGSFNVLEHTEDPSEFINMQLSVLKKGGSIIIACPNFLSVLFPNSHPKLRGFKNKSKNALTLVDKKINKSHRKFESMEPIIRKKFQYDDDAIVVTNLIDIRQRLEDLGCKVIYESGFINYDKPMYRFINQIPGVKFLLPSCFIVARKCTT